MSESFLWKVYLAILAGFKGNTCAKVFFSNKAA